MEAMVELRFESKRLMTVLALLAFSIAAARPAPKNPIPDDMDSSIRPGDDFYRYANGGWLKANAIPVGQSSYDTRAMLAEKTGRQVRDLIQNAASAHAPEGSVVQKVGGYYASVLD